MKTLLKIVADFQDSLLNSVNEGFTEATLVSGVDADDIALVDGLYGFTIDNNSLQKEYIVAQVTGGTALTEILSISRQGAVTTGFTKFHRKGAVVEITDWAAIERVIENLDGTTGLNGAVPLYYDAAPSSLSGNQIPTVDYVLGVVVGGTVTFSQQVASAQTLGDTIVVNDAVYFDTATQRWKLSDAATSAKFSQVKLGLSKSAGNSGTSGTTIAISGVVSGFVGLTAGSKYYLSDTPGAISLTPGTNTVFIGWALTTTTLVLSPQEIYRNPGPTAFDFVSGVTGMVVPYAGSVAPTGFLLCDGSAVSRTTYASLFTVISTAFGVGNGTTTFNIPDMRSRVPGGVGTGTKVLTFVSRSTDTISVSGAQSTTTNEIQTGQAVTYITTGSVITGLSNSTVYYIIRITSTTFKLASSLANAVAGTAISLSSDGSGTQTFTVALQAYSLGGTGGTDTHALLATELASHRHGLTAVTGSAGAITGILQTTAANGGPITDATSVQLSTGTSVPFVTINPFLALNYLIKT